MDSKTHITVEIDFPCRLTFSERMKVKKAAVDGALGKIETIFDEQRISVFEQMCKMTMEHFDLKPSEAELITDYVLNISGAYNHIINKLALIKEAREKNNY